MDVADVTESTDHEPVDAVEFRNLIRHDDVDDGSAPALSFNATVRRLEPTLADSEQFSNPNASIPVEVTVVPDDETTTVPAPTFERPPVNPFNEDTPAVAPDAIEPIVARLILPSPAE